jgi:hypothetical protein
MCRVIDWGSIKFVVRFATHILLGSALFALVAAVAIALHRLMGLMLDGANTIEYISPAISGVQIFIFGADMICLIGFVAKETVLLPREMWVDIRTKK